MFFDIFRNRIDSDKDASEEKETGAEPVKQQTRKSKDNFVFPFATHYELIDHCYSEIQEAFTSLGANTPDIATLASPSKRFRITKPFNRKHKGKIGFVVDLEWHNANPSFKLTVNSFVGGGASVAVNSFEVIAPYLAELRNQNAEQVKAIIERNKQKRAAQQQNLAQKKAQLKAKDEKDAKQRLENFKRIDRLYKNGSDDLVGEHPYILNKVIKHTGAMRVIDGNLICLPLYGLNERYLLEKKNLHSERIRSKLFVIKGYQVIDGFGNKKIYVAKSGDLVGAFAIVKGDLENARNVIISEGYASAEKAYQLSKVGNVCAIAAISASNMTKVVSGIKKYFGRYGKPKQLHIACDNDLSKQVEGKGNAGLRYGVLSLAIAGREGKIYIPHVNINANESDWDDIYRADKVAAKRQFVPAKATELELALLLLRSFASKEHLKGAGQLEVTLKKSLKTLIKLVPAYISLDELIAQITQALSHTILSASKIESIVKKAFSAYAKKANRVRELTDTYVDDYIEVESIDKAKAVIDAINENFEQNIILLKAEMGSGKTQGVINPIFKDAENKGYCPVTISPNRSLVKSIAHSVNASHYMYDSDHDFNVNFNSKKIIATGLATTINSFPCVRLQGFTVRTSVLMVDEATQVYRAMTNGTIPVCSRQTTEQKLMDTMNRCKQSIFADADLNDVLADHIKKRAKMSNEDTQVFAVVVTPKKRDDLTYNYIATTDQQYNHAINLKQLVEDALNGEIIFCPTDSLNQAKVIETALLKHNAIDKKDILLVSSETVGEQRSQMFFDHPDEFVKSNNIKVVITTPAVQSGISLQAPYFTKCYGFYFGTVTPTDMAQMLHRVRYLKAFSVSLPCPTPRVDQYNEDAQYIYIETLKMYIDNGLASLRYKQEIKDLQVVDGKVQLDDNIEIYEQLAAELKAIETQQRNNATNFFLIQAQSKGINLVNQLANQKELHADAKKEVKAEAKEIRQQIKDRCIQSIVGENTLSKEEYQTLVRKEQSITQEEQALKIRYEVAKMSGKSLVSEEDITFYQKEGNRKVNHVLISEEFTDAMKKDKQEIEDKVARVDRSNNTMTALILHNCYVQLGLDEQTLQGSFTFKDAQRLKEVILANNEMSAFLRLKLKIKIDESYMPTRLANLLLVKLLGLKARAVGRSRKEDRIQRYAFDVVEVERFLGYVQVERARREAKKAKTVKVA